MCDRISRAVPQQAARGYLIWGSGPFDAKLVRKVEDRALKYISDNRTKLEHPDLDEARAAALEHLNSDPADPHIQSLAEEMAASYSQFSIQAMPTLDKIQWTGWLQAAARTPDGENCAGEIRATLDIRHRPHLGSKVTATKKHWRI